MQDQPLTKEQRRRYDRHIILDKFGIEGQRRLLDAKVLVVGIGGLGSPIVQYLAAAGVGHLGMVDGDTVSLTNLQRQVIHATPDIGRPKVEVAEKRVKELNPDVETTSHLTFLSEENALDIMRDYDFIIDATDNYATKYLLNDVCVMQKKAFCVGGINKYSGQVTTVRPGSPCYRCLFPYPPEENEVETCATVGVLGPIAGILGTIQATEAIKHLTGTGEPLYGRLLTFDALTMQWQTISFSHDADCPLCGSKPSITELHEYSFMPCHKREAAEHTKKNNV